MRLRFPMRVVQTLLITAALHFPAIGYCDSGTGWFRNLFESKGKTMKDVAVKVAELPEQYNITVPGLDFSPDGKLLAVRSADQIINIWDWQNGRIVRALEKAQGANDHLNPESIRFSPDGRLFVACHSRAAGHVVVRIWNTDTWEIAHDIVDHAYGSGCNAIGFTPDSKSLIRVLERAPHIAGDTLIIYETSTWQPIWGMRTVPFFTYSLAISPDARSIALGGEVLGGDARKQQIAIVDMEQRTIVRTLQSSGVMNSASRLAWSPDGAYITAAGGMGLQMFDVLSGQQVVDVKPPLGTANTALRYTPDGKYLIEGNSTGKKTGWGKIWDGRHRELLQEISGNVGSIAVSRDGRYLATGTDGRTIVWQLK